MGVGIPAEAEAAEAVAAAISDSGCSAAADAESPPPLSVGVVAAVGGSPLLQAIEQYMAPRRGRNGLPSSDDLHV